MVDQSGKERDTKLNRIIVEGLREQVSGHAVEESRLLDKNPDLNSSIKSHLDDAADLNRCAKKASKASRETDASVASKTQADRHGKLPNARGKQEDGSVEMNESSGLPPEVIAGKKPFGRYSVLQAIGEGAMGAVYLAQDTQLNRRVALKTPKYGDDNRSRLSKRFRREAEAAATLHHRNICPVYDFGQIDGTDFLTMAYIEGKPLSAFIRQDKPLAQRQVALVVRKLAKALHVAHEAGVIHRDLKPSNVLIDTDGEPVLMDFGLAGRIDESGDPRLTRTGMIVGTPAYMAPEQI